MKLVIRCKSVEECEKLRECWEEFRRFSKLEYLEWYEKNMLYPDCGWFFDTKIGQHIFYCTIPPVIKGLVENFLRFHLPISDEEKEELKKIAIEMKKELHFGKK